MHTLLLTLHVLVAMLLIIVVLIQQPKNSGGGLFGGTGQSLLGTSGKTFWTKFTTALAVIFFSLCLALAFLPNFRQADSPLVTEIEKQEQSAKEAQQNQQAVVTPQAPASVPTTPVKSNPKPAKAPGSAK